MAHQTSIEDSRIWSGERAARVMRARDAAVAALRAERGAGPAWTGELSASALSTATAVTALEIVARTATADETRSRLRGGVTRGCAWLVRHQNADGGWGDTTRSFSNISTTTLVWAALGLCGDVAGGDGATRAAVERAEAWLARAAGSLEPEALVAAIERRYGQDRTFSIPILTMCALCGRLGPEDEAWRRVRQLPFELAALPQRWFGALQLPVVSYALPALIAIGQVRHGKWPTANVMGRWIRDRVKARTLRVLERLEPENGGFLEATPLTSFVTMSLAAIGLGGHPVARRGVAFIEASELADGSWAIDTNLATWVTTLAVNALGDEAGAGGMAAEERARVQEWLLRQQYRIEHPYTLAAPGGWAWTNLPGGVPDADDTAGAVLALARGGLAGGTARDGAGEGRAGAREANAQRLTFNAERSSGADGRWGAVEAARAGARWLLDLQNRDGGVPTFCRGWGKLPFDRSSPDITAHTMRAWLVARALMDAEERGRVDEALKRAVGFLRRVQREDGAWVPLWFGHQEGADDENPLYGTARVVPALCAVEAAGVSAKGLSEVLVRAVEWLVAKQNADGGWSGAVRGASSVEETGLAVEALVAAWERAEKCGRGRPGSREELRAALQRGGAWLAAAIEREAWREPTPIGFYFAKLWYWERLYPLIFATGALVRLGALR